MYRRPEAPKNCFQARHGPVRPTGSASKLKTGSPTEAVPKEASSAPGLRILAGLEHEFWHDDFPLIALQILLVLGVGVLTTPLGDG